MKADIVVIGGGLSGIMFAHFAAEFGKSVIILEKRPFPGGAIRTFKPYAGSDFFIELGAHTIYSSYATILEMIGNLGLKESIIPHLKPGYLMYRNGRSVSVLLCPSVTGLLAAVFRYPFYKKSGLTVKDYYTKVFGAKNYETIIRPMTSAVICQDSSEVAADLLLKRRRSDKSYRRAFSLQGGLQFLLEKAVSGKGILLHASVSVSSIKHNNDGYVIHSDSGEYTSDKIALAADAHNSANLIGCWSGAPDRIMELAALLKGLPMKRSIAFGVNAPANEFRIRRFGYIVAQNSSFRSVVSGDVIKHDSFRGATFHFKPETASDRYMETAREVLKINTEQLLNAETAEFLLPELRVTHENWRRKAEVFSDMKNFYLLGNYFGGLSLEDCAIRAKSEAKRAAGE